MCNTCNTGYTNANSSRCGCNSCQGYARQTCGCQNGARQSRGCGCGCGCNACGCGLLSWLFSNNTASAQSVCRDCNGCLRITNRSNGCGSCSHSCGCGCVNGTATANNGNGNGLYGCYTVCGRLGNGSAVTTANDEDGYYARQYGLPRSCGSYSSCNCGCD